MKNKFIAAAIIALLLVPSTVMAIQAPFGEDPLPPELYPVFPIEPPSDTLVNTGELVDVTSDDLEILYLMKHGVVKGNPDNTAAANSPLHRGEAVTIFSRMFKLDPVYDPGCTFSDVKKDDWFAGHVSALCNAGLVKGYPDGTFQAENQLVKAESTAMLVRALERFQGADSSKNVTFKMLDVAPEDWFAPYASYANIRNIVPIGSYFEGAKKYTRGDLFIDAYRALRTAEFGEEIIYSHDLDPKVIHSLTLETFSSKDALNAFAESAGIKEEAYFGEFAPEPTSDFEAVASPTSAAKEESITNVQEDGVDEGGIVKAHGDFLLVLRRGNLVTINTTTMEVVDREPVYQSKNHSTWYDEILSYENTVIVVGYSYKESATEIVSFDITDNGNLTLKETYFLDSNDYYSSRNYASRLVGSELIFYMPHYLFDHDGKVALPRVRAFKDGELTDTNEVLKARDVYKPLQDLSDGYNLPTLHTVVRCDLAKTNFECNAKAVLGPYARTFYVGPEAVYIWVSDPLTIRSEDNKSTGSEERAYIYRMGLKDDSVSVVQAYGQPIDQFSFKDDGTHLNVVVQDDSWGDGMWNPEFSTGDLALARLPLEVFTEKLSVVRSKTYRKLPKGDGGHRFQNKFIGDHLVYGDGSFWRSDTSSKTAYVTNYKDFTAPISVVALDHSVDRIERLGDSAAIIGTDGENLKFSSISLGEIGRIQDTYLVPDARQGELRSHGFFFKEYEDDYGVLGLPIRKEGGPLDSLIKESSQILFLGVQNEKDFSEVGSMVAGSVFQDDSCVVSCVDWYGNSRPIFYRGDVYGLMGYELVKATLTDNVLDEVSRLNFQDEFSVLLPLPEPFPELIEIEPVIIE